MKREIKFRLWDGENHKWFIKGEDGLVSNMVCCDSWDMFDPDDYVWCQYTGLKDNNGVEVYEGDIVSFDDSDGGYEYQDVVINTGIVEYGELGFYFTNRVAVEMDDFYIKDGRCDGIEVIGNIYENQELLEEEK